MDKNLNRIEKRWSFALLLTACLFPASRTIAQPTGIVARMLFPPRNYEIALGDSITPSVRVWNRDTVPHDSETIRYSIRNVVTRIAVYSRIITLPAIAAGDSLDTIFATYPTNPQILSQLGTFDGCLMVGSDTTCARLFGMRRTAVPYRDPSNNYGKTASGDIPDQTIWTSVGATVVDGEDSTWDPPPPRYAGGVGPDSLISPVLRLDRKDLSGNYYSGDGVGDTLTSFPINMQGKTFMNFMFDYMRSGRHHYPLGWDSKEMLGPESTILDSAGNVLRPGDSMILEFKKPSEPTVNPSPDGWNEIAAIDGGHDFEFKSCDVYVWNTTSLRVNVGGISKMIEHTPNYFTSDFRFRLRLKAKNDSGGSSTDDADAWYIDNPTWQWPNIPDFEVLWVRVVNPYTKVPRSQAYFPVLMNLHDYGYGSIGVFGVTLQAVILDSLSDTVYSQQIAFNFLNDTADTVIQFPDWDASGLSMVNGTSYTLIGSILPYVDHYTDDNETYSKFYLNVDNAPGGVQEFAYDDAGLDPGPNRGNNIPMLTGIPGSGIGFTGTSGSVAMKFQLARTDTLYGTRIYFGSANQAPDYIRLSLLNGDSNFYTPLDTVMQPGTQSTMIAERGGGVDIFNQFVEYDFPRPIVIPKGIYWMAVSQLGLVNMELGGNISLGGGQFVSASGGSPRIQSTYGPPPSLMPSYGTQWGSGPADNNGNVSCSFAMETPAGSGNWKPFMPDFGWWPTMTVSSGILPTIPPNMLTWTSAGTYLPMIRPVIGQFIDIPFGVTTIPSTLVFSLQPNYPNPFDPTAASTTITFTLPTQAPVSLTICNIMGDVVKTLVNAAMPAGAHSVSWDGRDEHGAVVPAGIYFVTLKSAGSHATAKLIVTE